MAGGFICPHCGWTGEPWVTSRRLLHCRGCQGQTSLTAGTIFQDTRKPLRMWFMAMWYRSQPKWGGGATARERWLTPDGETIVAPLPSGIRGHFRPELRRFVLMQYHHGQVTVDAICRSRRWRSSPSRLS
jgi:hypothetical protein